MAKKRETEFISERPMVGPVRGHQPAIIRVRWETWRDGSRYVMNHWLPVPTWMRHLDGVTVRGLVLALLVMVGAAMALARLLLAGGK